MGNLKDEILFNEMVFEKDVAQMDEWIKQLYKIAENTGDATSFKIANNFMKKFELIQSMYKNLIHLYAADLDSVSLWNLEKYHAHELLKFEHEELKKLTFKLIVKSYKKNGQETAQQG